MRFLRTYPKSICLVIGFFGVILLGVLFPMIAAKLIICGLLLAALWLVFIFASVVTGER